MSGRWAIRFGSMYAVIQTHMVLRRWELLNFNHITISAEVASYSTKHIDYLITLLLQVSYKRAVKKSSKSHDIRVRKKPDFSF